MNWRESWITSHDAEMAMPSCRRNRSGVVLALAALAAAGAAWIIWVTSLYGPGISTDSVEYITAARSLLREGRFLLVDGSPMRLYPPLYPSLIAATLAMGVDPLVSTLAISCASYGLVIFMGGLSVLRMSGSAAGAVAASLALLASPHLLQVNVMAWSEPLFNLLAVLFAWQMTSFVRAPSPRGLLLAGAWASLACLQRYTGAVFVIVGAIIVLAVRGRKWWKKLLWTGAFGAIAAGPVLLWMALATLRKYEATGHIMPAAGPPARSWLEAMSWAGGHLMRWAAMMQPPGAWASIAFLLAVTAALCCATAVLAWRHLAGRRDERPSPLLPTLGVALAYLLAMVRARREGRYAIADDRYLSPIFAPLAMLAACSAGWLWSRLSRRAEPGAAPARLPAETASGTERVERGRSADLWKWAAAAALAAWIGGNAYLSIQAAAVRIRDGAGGWNVREYRQSPTVAYLNTLALDGPILTSHQDLTTFYLNNRRFVGCVRKSMLGSDGLPVAGDWAAGLGFGPASPAGRLVWWRGKGMTMNACSMEELRRLFEMHKIEEFPDATVYEITPLTTAREE
jgi:4-amino-4-deoxy-L-arabinose transferase-like glycosyltransferase